MRIGVLALQGAFREHRGMIAGLGIDSVEVRLPEKLDTVDALIIPGGESTTIAKLLITYEFLPAIRNFASAGKPIFGTCAGAILLAGKQAGQKQYLLNLIDVDIARNAYGRQIHSREAAVDLLFSPSVPFHAIFIRAPIMNTIGEDVIVLGRYRNDIVLARQNNILISTFHPELTPDDRIHRYFLDMVQEYTRKRFSE